MKESQTNREISHYRILHKLGAGGMGEVYLAEDTKLDRKVAIKLLPADSVPDEQAKKRLVREAKAAATLDHPTICAIYEVGEEDSRSFIVMQYVDGETLASRIARKPLELREALDIAAQVADALAEAHTHGIIHRDIKPQNIMITAKRQVKLMDFGLARVAIDRSLVASEAETESLLTAPGVMVGTVPYMSPEQVKGGDLDARSDIFSFAVVIYEMLSGQRPFAAESAAATCSEILSRKQAPLARYCRDVPPELERIVDKALNKDREERYQTARDLLIDLRSLKKRLALEADAHSGGPAASTPTTIPVATSEDSAAATASPTVTTTQETDGEPARGGRHRWLAISAAAILAVGVAAYFALFNRATALTDKDSILIADFVNKTGDAVFDDSLKQALAVQLEQSPFMNIFPEERIRETLRFMARSPDERLTKDVAREICERQGIRAMLTGSIAPLGSHYVINLEVVNASTGEVVARQQVQAESKEQVLQTLGKAATKLREKLGESLASIQKFDVPLEQATTSSLEALKAFSMGKEQRNRAKGTEAIPLYKRAIELDPNFALAHEALSWAYMAAGRQGEPAAESAKRAFELRERTSEHEKLVISLRYYNIVHFDWEKGLEILELWKRTYPREPHLNLSITYGFFGQFERAIEESREHISLHPNNIYGHEKLALWFIHLNRFDEARQPLENALVLGRDYSSPHALLYDIAFIQGDTAAMKQQIDWANGKPDEYEALGWQARTAAFSGQLRIARDFFTRAIDMAERRGLKEIAADFSAEAAAIYSVFGNCKQARELAYRARTLARDWYSLSFTAQAQAICGEVTQAQSIADDLARRYPRATFIKMFWLPALLAAIEIHRGNADKAVQILEVARPHEAAAEFWPNYLRGQAYLRKGAASEAAAEFQKILDHRGWAPSSPLYPLAHLGLARAAALGDDTARSRKSYQDFFALWKDADSDIPILIEAKKEYERLK